MAADFSGFCRLRMEESHNFSNSVASNLLITQGGESWHVIIGFAVLPRIVEILIASPELAH